MPVGVVDGPSLCTSVGNMDGSNDGDRVGLEVGVVVGVTVGTDEGPTEGAIVGAVDGIPLGDPLGAVEGDTLGDTLGGVEGMPVGDSVGVRDGATDGVAVGPFAVGMNDGIIVGASHSLSNTWHSPSLGDVIPSQVAPLERVLSHPLLASLDSLVSAPIKTAGPKKVARLPANRFSSITVFPVPAKMAPPPPFCVLLLIVRLVTCL